GGGDGVAAVDDADRLDRRRVLVLERGQQPVLARCEVGRQLLEREQVPAELDEADDVAPDAALDLDEVGLGPLLERQAPREREERRLLGAREQSEVRARHQWRKWRRWLETSVGPALSPA